MILKTISYRKIITVFDVWRNDCRGLAATEFALVFPMLLLLLLGTIELGNGILANQKALAASQTITDLLSRTRNVSDEQLADALQAGRLALAPFDTADMGFDIISVAFDADSEISVAWRETVNMQQINNIEDKVSSLASSNEGLIVVYVRFPYVPVFGSTIVGPINMIENTFARGRKTAHITRV